MVAVNTFDAIKYGFRLMGYLLGVNVIAGVLGVVGFVIVGAGTGGIYQDPNLPAMVFGGLLAVVAYLVWIAGHLGVGYKVIADAVGAGTASAGATDAEQRQDSRPQQGHRGQGQGTGASGRRNDAGDRPPNPGASQQRNAAGSQRRTDRGRQQRTPTGGQQRGTDGTQRRDSGESRESGSDGDQRSDR